MKRLGQLMVLGAVVAVAVEGCTQVDGRWVSQDQASRQQEVAETDSSVPGLIEPMNEPAPTAVAIADEPAEDVSDFVRRLQMQEQQGGNVDSGSTTENAPDVVEDTSIGSAHTSANRGVAIPQPEQEGDFLALRKKPAQATEAPRVEAVSIVTTLPGSDEQADPKTLSTNEPLDATAVAEEFSIRKYTTMLEEALEDDPADVELQWLLSTMRLVMGDDDKATAISEEIAQEPAELLRDAIRLFADMRRLLVDPSHPADETLAALELLRTKLRERAELVIPVVALCTRVRTFGVYDEMQPDLFEAHQVNRTVVYTEVKNFVSKKLEDGQYETLLAGRLELLTRDGQLVWHHEEESIKEVSKQHREDFFLAQLVTFPANLVQGDYVLKVMIQDLLGGKANESHIEFSIGERSITSALR